MPDKTKVKERRRRLAAASKARRNERKRLQVIEHEERERRYRKDLVELKKDREVLDLFNGIHSHTLDAHATIKFLDRSIDLDEHAKHAFKRVTLTRCEKDPERKIRGLTQLQRTAREAAAAQKRCIDTSTPSTLRLGLGKRMQSSRKKKKDIERERHKQNLARSLRRRAKYVSPMSQGSARHGRRRRRRRRNDELEDDSALSAGLAELDKENATMQKGENDATTGWSPFAEIDTHKGELYHMSRGQVLDNTRVEDTGQDDNEDDDDGMLNMDDMRVELANLIVQRRLYRRLELESLFARAIRAAEPNELDVATVTLVVEEFREALGLSIPLEGQKTCPDIAEAGESFLALAATSSNNRETGDGDEKGAVAGTSLRTSTEGSTLRLVSSAWNAMKTDTVGDRDGAGNDGDTNDTGASPFRETAEELEVK